MGLKSAGLESGSCNPDLQIRIWKNQVRRTGFLVNFKLDFYCLYNLQKSVKKLIFRRLKIQFVELNSTNLIFQNSSTDQQGRYIELLHSDSKT